MDNIKPVKRLIEKINPTGSIYETGHQYKYVKLKWVGTKPVRVFSNENS